MGRGDRKTKKGKRTRGSYGNSRRRNKLIRNVIPHSALRRWCIERLYVETGQYESATTLNFIPGTESHKKYGFSITCDLIYNYKERRALQSRLQNGFLKETNGIVKANLLLKKDFTIKQVKDLATKGFHNTDILEVTYYRRPGQKNKFNQKGKKTLPEPQFILQVKQDPNHKNTLGIEYGFLQSRLEKGDLYPFEIERFAAITKILFPNAFNKDFIEKLQIDEFGVDFNYLYHSLRCYCNEIELNDKELEKITNKRRAKISSQVKVEFEKVGISSILDIGLNYLKEYLLLVNTGMEFKPEILIHTSPKVYWDFDRFLHIAFRHTWGLRINGVYKEKSTLNYDLGDLKSLIINVLEEISDELKSHFQKYPTTRFSKKNNQKAYYEGEYYEFHISPKGRLETFYNSEK